MTGSAPDAQPIGCSLVNISVTNVLVESPSPLNPDDEIVTLQFAIAAMQGADKVEVVAQARIRNVNVGNEAGIQPEVFIYVTQFIDLDAAHFMHLQNLTHETLLGQKIV